MEASIKGRLIRPAREVMYGFIFAPELWGWIHREFGRFAGKEIEITVREVEEHEERQAEAQR